MPKNIFRMSRSRSWSWFNARSTSFDSDSWFSDESAIGESSLVRTSNKLLSSPSTNGASTEMWRPDTFRVSWILSTGMSSCSASSSADGRRSFSCSNLERALLILFKEPTWLSGSLTIRDCSARAWRMDWRIHHTAYEINLKPRVSSNFCAALIRPRFPSLIKSGRLRPWFWYCFATDTTNLRLARVSLSNARWSPALIFCASSTSSSTVIRPSRPISCRYLSSDALSRLVIDFVIFNCLILTQKCVQIYQFQN